MSAPPESRGHLNPGGPVTISRLPPGPAAAELVRHYWVPQWALSEGRVERQIVLAYPASNLVVTPEAMTLAGPTTRASHRDLTGSSWAIGALMRPAAAPLVLGSALCSGAGGAASDTVDQELLLTSAEATRLRDDVAAVMDTAGMTAAVAAFEERLLELLGEPSEAGLLANRLQDAIEGSAATRVDDVARQLTLSTRSVQRLAREFVGQSPVAMIRRRRLQEAAEVARRSPDADLAQVAADHGYADHAHLTRDFRRVLGFTPSDYRSLRNPR